jgi:hypothetical protein
MLEMLGIAARKKLRSMQKMMAVHPTLWLPLLQRQQQKPMPSQPFQCQPHPWI